MTGLSQRRTPEQLTTRDHDVIASVERYRLLSSRHVQRLHFDREHPTSVAAARACNRTLARLRDLGMLRALERRVGGVRAGSAGFIWYLGPAGERLLDLRDGRRGRRNYREPSPHFVDHTLAVADLAVQTIGEARRGEFELLAVDSEPTNWQQSLSPHGQVQWLKPDLRIVAATDEFEHHWFVEVDLATEHLPVIERQCRSYLAHRRTGRYQAEHGVFPSVLWVAPDERRAKAIGRAVGRASGDSNDLFSVCSRDQFAAQLRELLTNAGGQEGSTPS